MVSLQKEFGSIFLFSKHELDVVVLPTGVVWGWGDVEKMVIGVVDWS